MFSLSEVKGQFRQVKMFGFASSMLHKTSSVSGTNFQIFETDFYACRCTLASGIDIGPTFIDFGFFCRPNSLIREYINVI